MKTIYVTLVFLLSTAIAHSQNSEQKQKEAINKLNWIVGEWKGTSIVKMGPANADTVIMHETISKELDGTIIKIRGIGYDNKKQSKIVHNALAIISFDVAKNQFRWQSWRVPGGYYAEYNPVIEGESLSWSMETPRGIMRYHLKLNDEGHWDETGEFSSDGERWTQFMKMVLIKE